MILPPNPKGLRRFLLSVARAWRLVWQAAPRLTSASVVLLIMQSALPLAALYLLKMIVDAITAATTHADTAAVTAVFVLIAVAAGVALLAAGVNAIAKVVGEAHSELVTDYMQEVLHAKSIEVDLEYYESPQYQQTLHRAQQEAPYRPARIVRGLMETCQSALSLIAMATALLSFHWSIALVLFVAVVPEALAQLKYAERIHAWRRARTPTERYAQYYDWMMTGTAHAQELRLFDLGAVFMRQFRRLRELLRRERFELVARRSAAEFGTQVLSTLAVFGAYAFIAYRAVGGAITLGDLVLAFAAFQRGQEFLRQLLRALAGLYEDSLFLSNLYEFLDLRRKLVEPPEPKPVPRPLRKGFVFERVSFHYGDNGQKQALCDIDLVIPAGATVALVGENGSGKTTLVKLLARLYDPSAGRITLDGIDLREFSTVALRKEISVIFQDYVRYNLTARENIWFGNVAAEPDAERIASAANFAGVGELIRSLPRAYETVLGKWFDDGEELSVGEWQKIALARTLLREAQVVVLDEPTSAMDAEAERDLFERFHEVAAGRTAILISHRLSTVKMADLIYVLRAGRVVESGTHSELVRKQGRYADLFAAQASGYR
jgi:ATP-binding cassette subfamily B protein